MKTNIGKVNSMKLSALLRKRRNVYGFLAKSLPDEILLSILEDATHVPSAGFTQDFDLIVVRNQTVKKKLADAARQDEYKKMGLALSDFISIAPAVVVPCANKKRFEAKYGKAEEHARLPWWLVDAGFASLALLLSAFEKGLASSFLGAIDDQKVIEILGLPRDGSVIPLAAMPIGYKDVREQSLWKDRSTRANKIRRPLGDTVHWDKW